MRASGSTNLMKNIVTVGGGTGSYTVLSGLKNLKDVNLSAIVSMADNGGSTGLLRQELGVLPPGDIRQCLVALSEESEEVKDLLNYRFEEGTLKSHPVGNLILAALEKTTGDFASALEIASKLFKVRGRVVPVTLDNAELLLTTRDGEEVLGEREVDSTNIQEKGIQNFSYQGSVKLSEQAQKAILNGDYILIGPGNHYASVLPNLVVPGFKETLEKSRAKIILPVNLTNRKGHTILWKVSDYVNDLEKYLGKKADYILVNTDLPSREQLDRYESQEGTGVLVEDDLGNDPRVMRASLLSDKNVYFSAADELSFVRSFIRHDPQKLADVIEKIINA